MPHQVARNQAGCRNVRVTVHLPPLLRDAVDRSAERHRLSRSGEISRLLRIALGKPFPDPPEMRRVRARIA